MDELLALSSAALPPHLMTDVRGVLDAANTVQTLRRVVRAGWAVRGWHVGLCVANIGVSGWARGRRGVGWGRGVCGWLCEVGIL